MKREPDLQVGLRKNGTAYLRRWWRIPRNRWFNIYVHEFGRSDEDRALHDHPWWSISFLLKGELLEHSFKGIRHIPRWLPVIRSAKFAHRLELIKGPAWTIFITGPVLREWGFHTKEGWLPHDEFMEIYGCHPNQVGD